MDLNTGVPESLAVFDQDMIEHTECFHAAVLGGKIRDMALALSPTSFLVSGSRPGLAGDPSLFAMIQS